MEPTWTSEQNGVIDAPPEARLLIEAGPGTGKTAVACARVAKLLERDALTPSSILMISFTRTAVAEMKSRILLQAESGKVQAVNICTLDRAAFSFGVGCGERFESLMGSFEGNIAQATGRIAKKDPLLLEYFSALQHVIIDEAQDLTSSRLELVELLIGALPKTTGLSIFTDPAQAIYGFTNDVDEEGRERSHFSKSFDPGAHGIARIALTRIHRTTDKKILGLFTRARAALDRGSLSDVIEVVEELAPAQGEEFQSSLRNGDLVLYRKRASALMDAQFCQTLFRLRLSGYPPAVVPWVGLVFAEWTEPEIAPGEFEARWAEKVPAPLADGFTVETAWALLRRFARNKDAVNVERLRKLLGARPSVEFCLMDYGSSGPVFSTIHASKGREAERVLLMLPRKVKEADVANEEEARIVYVGATRVRKELARGIAKTMAGAGGLDQSGRRIAQVLDPKKRPKFQFGLAGDLDEAAPVSRAPVFAASAAAAMAHQAGLVEAWTHSLEENAPGDVAGQLEEVEIDGQVQLQYRFLHGGTTIAWSADGLRRDLVTAGKLMQKRSGCSSLLLPQQLPYLRLIGLRTSVFPQTPALLGRLHEPFATSGFCLSPMIVGFPSIFLPFAPRATAPAS